MPADKMMKGRKKRVLKDMSEEEGVRLQAAKDLVSKGVTERNPVAHHVKDTYDTLNDLEKLWTGKDKSLLDRARDR